MSVELPPFTTPAAKNWEALYILTAKSLQSYVMAGGKLREMTGATLLIDELPRRFLETVLETAGMRKDVDWWPVTQASGIARLLMASLEAARQIERLMPLAVAEFAPGMEVVQALVSFEGKTYPQAAGEAEQMLIAARNFPPPALPAAPPLATLNPRTGLPAVSTEHGGRLDLPAWRKRQRRNAHRDKIRAGDFSDITSAATYSAFGFGNREHVALHFPHLAGEDGALSGHSALQGPDADDEYNPGMEALAGGERKFIAVVHADGNGMGEMFIKLGDALAQREYEDYSLAEVAGLYAALSLAVNAATIAALKASSGAILEKWELAAIAATKEKKTIPPLPVWPVVAAGDDLTALFRADVALRFAEDYITAFSEQTAVSMARVKERFAWAAAVLPDRLTAGAGVTLCKSHYPFRTAYALCESLASHAKKKAKRDHKAAGAVTFHQLINSAHVTTWDTLEQGALKGADDMVLSQAPYFIGVDNEGETVPEPRLRSLHEFADTLRWLPSGAVRQLLTHLRTDCVAAERHWNRVREVAKQQGNSPADSPLAKWESFCAALCKLTGGSGDDFSILFDNTNRTPLADALALLASNPATDTPHESAPAGN